VKIAKRRCERGFTLLEVLVTLSVLAITSALILSLISGSLAGIRKVQSRTRTIQHAETVMELSLLDESIKEPTTLHGDFADGTRWSLVVGEFELPETDPVSLQQAPVQMQMPLKIFSYTVEIMGPESASPDLRLQTLKLINTAQPAGPARLRR